MREGGADELPSSIVCVVRYCFDWECLASVGDVFIGYVPLSPKIGAHVRLKARSGGSGGESCEGMAGCWGGKEGINTTKTRKT